MHAPAGSPGLGNTGRAGEVSAKAPEPPADPGRGESVGGGRLLPGVTEVSGEGTGQPELGVGDDQNPGPAVRRSGVRSFGVVQARL